MLVQDFTEDKEVLLIINELQKIKAAYPEKFNFSDVVDNEGNQYVDLVQEGGGVLGIALLGYTYVMEQLGIRFLKLAGTSAGAINTVLIAAAGKPSEAKSVKIIEHVANTNFYDFVDGDSDAKNFIEAFNRSAGTLTMVYRGVQILDNLKEDLGLNPGRRFFEWLKDIICGFGIDSTEDLNNQLWDLPEEVHNIMGQRSPRYHKSWPIAIIAADITTETKVSFPDMAGLYFHNPEEINPAYYVRASMSVPIFFSPLKIVEIPDTPKHKLAWKELTNYIGPHPEKVYFVDGGVMSNFPIDVFHVHDRVPQRPTFGVKLGLDRDKINEVDKMNYMRLIGATFNAARNIRDNDFINSNPDYQKLVAHIDTGHHNWLNFDLSDEDKLDLFRRGAQRAAEFLVTFDWRGYQELRRNKLFSIASKILGKDTSYFRNKLDRAGKLRSMYADDEKTKTLITRLQFLEVLGRKIRILWLDDSTENDKDVIELVESIGSDIEYAGNSEEATELLKKNNFDYDLIISDIKRGGVNNEGIEFLKKLHEGYETDIPPTIFYITDFKPELGTPPYAFGITNSPIELIHLVADIIQRDHA